ncbi:MAG: universal stress protein [Hyphomicrobiaceae bacterium]
MRRIAHTTDFSPASHAAFHHALALALAARAALDIIHVAAPGDEQSWESFPQVRQTLTAWGRVPAGATPADVEPMTGVLITKVEIARNDALAGLARHFARHRPDLIVAATHAREGIDRMLHGSMSEDLIARTRVPAFLIGPRAASVVDPATGMLAVTDVVLPLAESPPPEAVIDHMEEVLAPLGLAASRLHILTVGCDMPDLLDRHGRRWPVSRRDGPVVETIVAEAQQAGAGLIAMPTAGRHGLMDAMRGSTTSQVLASSPVPVLALPVLVR